MQQAISKDQIWKKLEQLNLLQQQTVLAFIDSLANTQPTVGKRDKSQLLNLSIWTEEDIQSIQEAQDRINAWQLPTY
ncbi:MAG TPA: hypothetical protein P5121_40145 [Caldilineaceae bacterium]|nr:hypothetical protein [Caldilineaceae bacterium]